MRRSNVVWVLASVALLACTGPVETPEPQPATALGELARMRATGRLESNRLECAMLAMVHVVDEMRARLPALREARSRDTAALLAEHRESVRANQVQAEVTQAAGARAAMMRKQALFLQAAGHDMAALRTFAHSGRLLEQARGDRLVTSSDNVVVPLLSDEEADRLAEYTRLRSEHSESLSARDPIVSDRLHEIEREQDGIQETYAQLFLQVYQDPELRCTPSR